ncbi:MAG: glycosyltransferase family 9 protein, partial [Planctomycetota bacterium]|nr:glycosyltransferase family 9 protein [Planctomycetota bacterium]
MRFVWKILFEKIPSRRSWQPKRILVHRYGNIGDMVVAIPALVALRKRFPNAHITLLTSPGSEKAKHAGAREILSNSPLFDEMMVYHTEDLHNRARLKETMKRIRGGNYDLLVALTNAAYPIRKLLREMVFFRLCGIKKSIGWQYVMPPYWLRSFARGLKFEPQAKRLLSVISPLGIDPNFVEYHLTGSEEDAKWAEETVSQLRKRVNKIIVIHPGGKRETTKWFVERYAQLASRILKEFPETMILVTGGKDDREAGNQIASVDSSRTTNLAGSIGWGQFIELLRRVDLVVSNDSGGAHIAAATTTPLVAIYGQRNFCRKWDPIGNACIIVVKSSPLPCEGCSR